MEKSYLILLALFLVMTGEMQAQVSFSAQMRTRSELRNGQGTLISRGARPAFFTSQRTRVGVAFSGHRFRIYGALQDVRVWGQDASTVNRITSDAFDGLMLHEAWGEFSLVDTGQVIKLLTIKIGRQELVYDDVRLLGNLDWLQQARRHDALVLKFEHNGWTAHAGFAFNQNTERKSGTIYNGVPGGYPAGTNGVGTMYKSMQFVYAARKFPAGTVSFLGLKDDFSKYAFAADDSLKSHPIYEDAAWSRFTVGSNLFAKAGKKIMYGLSAFFQGGNYRDGTPLNEYLLSASLLYAVSPVITAGPGIDITSGNNGADPSKRFQRFDPLYGTPHKFWGYMDYFYVADGSGPGGLIDYYVRTKFTAGKALSFTADVHRFVLPEPVLSESGADLDKALGTEIDLVANYSMTRAVNVETGFSLMLSTPTMAAPQVKNVSAGERIASWAYLMISIKPEIMSITQK